MTPTDEQVRDAARGLAPELTAVLGAADSALSDGTTSRVLWARMAASRASYRTDSAGDRLLLVLGYLLAHRTTADLMGSQGSTSAPIGSAASVGGVASTSVGAMSISYGTSGRAAMSDLDADLMMTAYGRSVLSMRATRSRPNVVASW